MVQYQGDRGERIYTFHLFTFFLPRVMCYYSGDAPWRQWYRQDLFVGSF